MLRIPAARKPKRKTGAPKHARQNLYAARLRSDRAFHGLGMPTIADGNPAAVIGPNAMLRDRPGFDVEFLTGASVSEGMTVSDQHNVLLVHEGHWRLSYKSGESTLAPGDTCAVPPGLKHGLEPSMTGTCSLFKVISNNDPAGPTATDLN